jgi:TRAP-type C4-dicarboxylate transport system permease small subunit
VKRVLRRLDRFDGWLAAGEAGLLCALLFGLMAGGLALAIQQHTRGPTAGDISTALLIGGVLCGLGGVVLLGVTRRLRGPEGTRGGRLVLVGVFALLLAGALHLETAVDHLVRATVLWLGLVGAGLATRRRRHITIEILDRILAEGPRRVVAVVTSLVATSLLVFLLLVSLEYVGDARASGEVFVTIHATETQILAWWVKAILPVGLALMAWRFVLIALEAAFVGLPPKDEEADAEAAAEGAA